MGRRPSASKSEKKDKEAVRVDRTDFVELVHWPQPDQAAGPYSVRKKSPLPNTIRTAIRRSTRAKDPARGIHIKDPAITHVTISEIDEEDDRFDLEDDELEQGMSTFFEENTEDKIDYLIQVVEAQGKKIDTLISKFAISCAHETRARDGDGSDTSYKGLYVEGQRKIEALTEENCQLTMKLTIAESKVEMLMSNPQHLADLAGNVRDIFI